MAQTPRIGAPKIINASHLKILGRPIKRFVDIAADARDGGEAGVAAIASASTSLVPGLLLVRATSGTNDGKYVHYDNDGTDGTQNEEDIVILLESVDVSDGDQRAHVGYGGNAVYKRGQFRFALAADKTAIEWSKVTLDSLA